MTSPSVHLLRHGETEWSALGKHTGRTDVPLSARGRDAARRLAPALAGEAFALVLTSPLVRARETCELAGLGGRAVVDPDLLEWDYGEYESRTSAEIRAARPGWMLFTDGCPGGESPAQVTARADRVIERIRATKGDVAIFAHGHVSRVLAARWLGLPAVAGSHLLLDTATLSILGDYQGIPAVRRWNAPVCTAPARPESAGHAAGPAKDTGAN
jgi:probable phosphoglycerate mutase